MELMQTGEAAAELKVSDERVRQLEAAGKLSAFRTSRGVRLFLKRDVERLRDERQGKREREAKRA